VKQLGKISDEKRGKNLMRLPLFIRYRLRPVNFVCREKVDVLTYAVWELIRIINLGGV
jgi:hypothetical protein